MKDHFLQQLGKVRPAHKRPNRGVIKATMVAIGLSFGLHGAAAAQTADPVEPVGQDERLRVNVHADLLGFALMGPTLSLETGRRHFSALLSARWLNAGFLARKLVPNTDGDEELAASFGVGLRGRYYLLPNLTGFYGGLGAEILRSRVEDRTVDQEAYLATVLVPELELGHRWPAFSRGFVDLGIAAGFTTALSTQTEDLSGGTRSARGGVDASSQIFGSLTLAIGIFFDS